MRSMTRWTPTPLPCMMGSNKPYGAKPRHGKPSSRKRYSRRPPALARPTACWCGKRLNPGGNRSTGNPYGTTAATRSRYAVPSPTPSRKSTASRIHQGDKVRGQTVAVYLDFDIADINNDGKNEPDPDEFLAPDGHRDADPHRRCQRCGGLDCEPGSHDLDD